MKQTFKQTSTDQSAPVMPTNERLLPITKGNVEEGLVEPELNVTQA